MFKIRSSLTIISALFIFMACNSSNSTGVLTQNLTRSNFIEKLQVEGTLEAIRNTPINAPPVYPLTVLFMEDEGTYVKKGDTICLLESERVLTEYNNTLIELERTMAENNKKRADMELQAELFKAQIKDIEVQAALSSLDSLQLEYVSPSQRKIKELQLEINNINYQKVMKKLKIQETINTSEFNKMRLQVDQKKRRIKSAEMKLAQLVLTAPNDGYIIYESVFGRKLKEGDQVFPNMTIMQIPNMESFQVNMKVNERKFKRINKKQKVNISLDALQGKQFTGWIESKTSVAKKSGTSIFGGGGMTIVMHNSSRNDDTKLKYFDVLARIEGDQSALIPGMSSNCEIFINEIQDTIVVPQVSIFENDSSKFVYVLKNNKFKPINVSIGTFNSKEAIISKGLEGNETIALTRPSSNLIH